MPPVCRSQIEVHEIHRGKGLEVRLSLALALSTTQVTVRINLPKLPELTIDGDTTDFHFYNLDLDNRPNVHHPYLSFYKWPCYTCVQKE
ncbi:hypothetical protein TNCV_819851 [Trichonephila clavipes]|nr:hypothetical protein TNCV_819851 [Trichonephila clavipes]